MIKKEMATTGMSWSYAFQFETGKLSFDRSGKKEGEWNTLKIRMVDDTLTTWLNGIQMIQLKDEKIGKGEGAVALQIHDGGGIKVKWKNLILKEL